MPITRRLSVVRDNRAASVNPFSDFSQSPADAAAQANGRHESSGTEESPERANRYRHHFSDSFRRNEYRLIQEFRLIIEVCHGLEPAEQNTRRPAATSPPLNAPAYPVSPGPANKRQDVLKAFSGWPGGDLAPPQRMRKSQPTLLPKHFRDILWRAPKRGQTPS